MKVCKPTLAALAAAGVLAARAAGQLPLAATPVPLARRAVRRWLRADACPPHPPDREAVERVLAVARGEVRACEVGGDVRVRRSRGRLLLERAGGR